ncbi:hypothetical protein LCGC14_0319890 [marine sediment metagenome]|uniref:Uncharacterized protein n=1 Tax=marine sediment metagenome TaxID=412755 RepID=A0A0F9W6U3_9ZZZZ
MKCNHKLRSHQENLDLVDDWVDVPIGTEVVLKHDDGHCSLSFTRSAPEFLGGHTPVIWLRGWAACWALDRVARVL